MVSNDISWPEFSNDLDAVTHAIGLTILDYVRLQTTFNRFISITGLLDSKTFSFLRRTLNNSEKSQFLKILLESIDTNVENLAELSDAFIKRYNICTENRNILAHCSVVPKSIIGPILQKTPSKKLSSFKADVEGLREIAESIRTTSHFGENLMAYMDLNSNIPGLRTSTMMNKQAKTGPPTIPPLPRKMDHILPDSTPLILERLGQS